MTRQRFLAKQQCVENVIVVDALDVTRNRAVSLECACSAEIVYYSYNDTGRNYLPLLPILSRLSMLGLSQACAVIIIIVK